MPDDQDNKRVDRKALAILVPLMFIALVAKAVVLGGSVWDIIIGISIVTLIYGTLIGIDLYRNR